MNSDFTDSHKLRKFLLLELADEPEIEGIEKEMLSSESFLAEIDRVETELIEEYLDQTLSAGEQEYFEKYFLTAPERKAKFRFMLALREKVAEYAAKELTPAGGKTSSSRPHRGVFLNDLFASGVFKLAALGLLVMAIGTGLFWYFSTAGKVDQGLAALNAAYKDQRATEARLSGMDYAPAITTRGRGEIPVDQVSSTRAGLLLASAAQESPSANSHRALGLYYASLRQYDQALEQFTLGATFNPADAQFSADHGAVLLEKAKSLPTDAAEKRLQLLDSSLTEIDAALKRNGDFLPALFNRALCLEEMSSSAAAREAWQKYLEKDGASPWSKEAREHLKTLSERETSKTPAQVRSDFLLAYDRGDPQQAWEIARQSKEMITGTMISDQLTRGFLSADAQGAPKDAERMLSALNFLGKLEKENSGDGFFLDAADYYHTTGEAQRAKLNAAQNLLADGYEFCLKSKYSEAFGKFTEAQKQFDSAGNQWDSLKTSYWLSYCQQHLDQTESAKIADALIRQSRQKHYKWLLEQALIQSASAAITQSRFSPAIRDNKEAVLIAREISDPYGSQKAYGQLADVYSQVNDLRPALENSQNSLRVRGDYFNSPRQTWRNYMFASQAARRFGLAESSIAYGLETVSLAKEIGDTTILHDSFLYLSSAYQATLDYNDSLGSADESLRIGESLDDGPIKKRLIAFSLFQQGETQRLLHNCPQAIETYGQAIEILNTQGLAETLKAYSGWKGKLICYSELGQEDRFEEILPRTLALAEKLRGQIEEEESRTSFFSDEQSVYESAAVHALKKGDSDAAFDYIENGKARTLLDRLGKTENSAAGGTGVLPLNEIRSRLPADSQLVQYALLSNKLYIWLVTNGEVRRVEKDISASDLERDVREFATLISHAGADTKRLNQLSSSLYSTIFQPIEPYLEKDKAVSIVYDKALCYLPFGALRSASGEYAIRNFRFVYAPSATLFVMLSEKARAMEGVGENFIGVGNPAFDRDENPGLADLPSAEREIDSSAAFYRKKQKFIGPQAIKARILASLPQANIFHFAGHFQANELSPQYSKFLLAREASEDDNYLTTDEIRKMKLPVTRLVVLSACKTAIEDYYRGEGAIGAARTFFAAGVPQVVASRWEVDSAASTALMTAFHRYHKEQGLPVPAALRAAQLELLASDSFNSPYYWAAFAAVGGLEQS